MSRKKIGRKRQYDWPRWFSRRRFTLTGGIDYQCSTKSMAQQVRNAASARGILVSIVESPGGLTVVVYQPEVASA